MCSIVFNILINYYYLFFLLLFCCYKPWGNGSKNWKIHLFGVRNSILTKLMLHWMKNPDIHQSDEFVCDKCI